MNRPLRLTTREVKIGNLLIGNGHPIRIQTMTTTDTMHTAATVAQCIRCVEAGAELVRITAPSKNEAENLLHIKNELRARGYSTPLIADIHFTPNAAEIAARIVEKVRINPGNYIDKKKFDFIEYTDQQYAAEVDRIRDRFTPLVRICREYGTAMRIGVNHGSLSDRIMSRYGDTPIGMVESALEFLRITRSEDYHQVVLSMKSSNPIVMVQAYRLLVRQMQEEFGECYPLHLGVTEAGDGADGRIKSAIGIGTLLEDGIGDTIRVSLTEDPEFEIPVCKDILQKSDRNGFIRPENSGLLKTSGASAFASLPYNPFEYKRRETIPVGNIGGNHVPVVVTDFSARKGIRIEDLEAIGYRYDALSDKWHISDGAADYIIAGSQVPDFPLPGTLQVISHYVPGTAGVISNYNVWKNLADKPNHHPLLSVEGYCDSNWEESKELHFIVLNPDSKNIMLDAVYGKLKKDRFAVLIIGGQVANAMLKNRHYFVDLIKNGIQTPVIISSDMRSGSLGTLLVDSAIDTGGLLLDGLGDGLMLSDEMAEDRFINDTAFTILQATRTRISKTEYISCPSCGRTLFDLQETTAKIRAVTHHLKGVKIAIMGCIVNGPGEMADADFGYVGSGPGKITLYRGKDIMKRNVPSDTAVKELIELLKENEAWIEPAI